LKTSDCLIEYCCKKHLGFAIRVLAAHNLPGNGVIQLWPHFTLALFIVELKLRSNERNSRVFGQLPQQFEASNPAHKTSQGMGPRQACCCLLLFLCFDSHMAATHSANSMAKIQLSTDSTAPTLSSQYFLALVAGSVLFLQVCSTLIQSAQSLTVTLFVTDSLGGFCFQNFQNTRPGHICWASHCGFNFFCGRSSNNNSCCRCWT
jgi:hypothetical protein